MASSATRRPPSAGGRRVLPSPRISGQVWYMCIDLHAHCSAVTAPTAASSCSCCALPWRAACTCASACMRACTRVRRHWVPGRLIAHTLQVHMPTSDGTGRRQPLCCNHYCLSWLTALVTAPFFSPSPSLHMHTCTDFSTRLKQLQQESDREAAVREEIQQLQVNNTTPKHLAHHTRLARARAAFKPNNHPRHTHAVPKSGCPSA